MRIVSWNCNGAFRKKFSLLDEFKADIYIIQECEDPSRSSHKAYIEWAKNSLWVGKNKNKGLGVFAHNGHRLQKVEQALVPLELFLPCIINDDLHLLAIWTREANSPTFKYIGQLWKYLELHSDFLKTKHSVAIGDLNSNSCWDVWDRWWNHSDVVKVLKDIGLQSLYHLQEGEEQGGESKPTFYMYRRVDRPYHIDFAFLSEALFEQANLGLGSAETWLKESDHMPLVIDL